MLTALITRVKQNRQILKNDRAHIADQQVGNKTSQRLIVNLPRAINSYDVNLVNTSAL